MKCVKEHGYRGDYKTFWDTFNQESGTWMEMAGGRVKEVR